MGQHSNSVLFEFVQMKIKIFILSIFLCFLYYPLQNIFAERITILEPSLTPDPGEGRVLVDKIIKNAALTASRWYEDYIEVEYLKGDKPSFYDVEIVGYFSEDITSLVVTTKRRSDEKKTDSFYLRGEISNHTAWYLANVIFYQWCSFNDFLSQKMVAPPVFVDELSTDYFARSMLPGNSWILSPTSVNINPDGNALIGSSYYCIEMDYGFRVLDEPGKSLFESGNYNFAYGVYVTPGGTIFLKPSAGREIYRLTEGTAVPQKLRVNMDLLGPFAALPDGSYVIVDIMKKRSARYIGKKRHDLDLLPSQFSTISAITAGPEGNLWVYDTGEKRVRIYSADGTLIDSIMPIVDPSIPITASNISVYADGRFILNSFGELWCFKRDGIPLWRLKTLGGFYEEPLPQFFTFAADPSRGAIYIGDQMGRRIIKLLDIAYCKEKGIGYEFDKKIMNLNTEQLEKEDDPSPTMEKARIYGQMGSLEMTEAQWERVLEIDPDNPAAENQLNSLNLTKLKRKAEALKQKTHQILERLGPESARTYFSRTIQLYEQILSIDPDDEQVHKDLRQLKGAFSERETTPDSKQRRVSIKSVKIQNIFPSLMQYYREYPVGYVTIKNTLDVDITSLTVRLFIKKYMDFPSETEPVGRVKPGESVRIDLKVFLNSSVFELQEDLPVQVQIDISYFTGDSGQKVSKNVNSTIYRRTALSWDDSGKLASFITPNEGIVSTFSHRVSDLKDADKNPGLSKKFLLAIKICDALGKYNINYIEDPSSPFSKVLGKEEVVDTVRFPRTTLLIRSGDCDDSTALLGSLLESAGINTAIITSPGHVFLAFDTGEPEQNAWYYKTGQLDVVMHHGTFWIPVETTVLQEGFLAAWTRASELITSHLQKGEIEFLPVYNLRGKYPPLPLPESNFTVVEPAGDEIHTLFKTSVEDMVDNLYKNVLTGLEKKLNDLSGINALRTKNKIGILHARFGHNRKAETIFKECIKEDPDFIPPYLNLANLEFVEDDVNAAIDILGKGLKKRSDSPYLNLLMARCYYNKKDFTKVMAYYNTVKAAYPELADRHSYLVRYQDKDNHGAGGRERAGPHREELPFIWDTGE